MCLENEKKGKKEKERKKATRKAGHFSHGALFGMFMKSYIFTL